MQSLLLVCDEILATEDQNEVQGPLEPASPLLAPLAGTEEPGGKQSTEEQTGRAVNRDTAQKINNEETPRSQRLSQGAFFGQACIRNVTTALVVSKALASPKTSMRHHSPVNIGNGGAKRQKQATTAEGRSVQKDISTFFKMTSPVPKDFHQVFSERLPEHDPAIAWLLTRVFFGIGSPSSFEQLSKICTTLRQSQSLPTSQAVHGLRQVVNALDSLDIYVAVASVPRRYFLVSLKDPP